MYKHDDKSVRDSKSNHSLNNPIKIINNRFFCQYCRNYIPTESIQNQRQVICCNICSEIIRKNDKIHDNKLNLSAQELNAIKLLEINHNLKLPVLNPKILRDFSKKNKKGIVIKDTHTIAIFLDNEPLYQFPDELFYFPKLRYISLMNTRLTKVSSYMYKFTNLEAIDLRKNTIEFLSDSFTRLKKLKVLNLSNNLLRLLPDDIGALHTLVHLNVENNLLYALPESFKDLKNLKTLNLFDNQLNLKLMIGKMPPGILKCGIGGNTTKKSFRLLRSIFKSKKTRVYLDRNKSWEKK